MTTTKISAAAFALLAAVSLFPKVANAQNIVDE